MQLITKTYSLEEIKKMIARQLCKINCKLNDLDFEQKDYIQFKTTNSVNENKIADNPFKIKNWRKY